MFNKLLKQKEYIVIGIVVILFICVSSFSLYSINQLQGNARVINYSGIVRGATQRLIKKEIQGHPDDGLITLLDSIIDELIHGGAKNSLISLHDKVFQGNMALIEIQWAALKNEIHNVRSGSETDTLYRLSEAYFELADQTVSSAEVHSEAQVRFSKQLLFGVNMIFLLFMAGALISYLRSIALKRREAHLQKVAYMDKLTRMPNRASCEKQIEKYTTGPLDGALSVLMFDMNNLKLVNDVRGHQGGDRLIAEFGRILEKESEPYGFIGRYGGDEFLGIFKDVDQSAIEKYLASVNTEIVAWNLLQADAVDKISFAVGCCRGEYGDNDLQKLINIADQNMYKKKREMKENKN